MNKEEKIKTVIDVAEFKFWDTIAKAYPEATTGDLCPVYVERFSAIMKECVEAWVDTNVKDPVYILNHTAYNFETMILEYNGNKYPLRWDGEGKQLDFFDHQGDQYWIWCSEEVTAAYLKYKEQ